MLRKDQNITIHQKINKLHSMLRKIITGNDQKRIRDKFREVQDQPKYVKLFDKIAFTIGVLNMGICQYFLLNKPQLFPIWYAIIMPLLLISRYVYFHGVGLQYFMIDFCYFIVFCSLSNILFIKSAIFFKFCFICSCGPLSLAIPLWRNSFVFHDYDKIISVYIHILPCMLYYTMRWYDNNQNNHITTNNNYYTTTNNLNTINTIHDTVVQQQTNNILDSSHLNVCYSSNRWNNCEPLLLNDYIRALLGYVLWQICYLLKTEYFDKSKLDEVAILITYCIVYFIMYI